MAMHPTFRDIEVFRDLADAELGGAHGNQLENLQCGRDRFQACICWVCAHAFLLWGRGTREHTSARRSFRRKPEGPLVSRDEQGKPRCEFAAGTGKVLYSRTVFITTECNDIVEVEMRPLLPASIDSPAPLTLPRVSSCAAPEAGVVWCCHGMPVFQSPAEAREFGRGAGLVAKLAVAVAAAAIGVLTFVGVPLF
jgi:hypothetical protein